MVHPLFDVAMPSETGPAPYRHIPPAELRPAPMPGEHTREICHKVLALGTEEIDRLIAEGVLFTSTPLTNRRERACLYDDTPLMAVQTWTLAGEESPLNANRSPNPGAGRLRPGQPARRPSRGGTGRPDGGGGPRRRRPAGPGGASTPSGSSACCRGATAIPACCSPSASGPRTRPPATPASAGTCRRRWSTRPAWISRPDAPTS